MSEGERIEDYRKRCIISSRRDPKLEKIDPSYRGGHASEASARAETLHYLHMLSHQQIMLYASARQALLIVLQGLDTSGKDGTIRHVLKAFNPQGTAVTAFNVPTAEERAHDFLWRIHARAPAHGWIGIFNRSHYEDVLVPVVHAQIDRRTCERRYEAIRAFEELLARNGTHIVKLYLHISKEEQLARFGARLDDPSRNWKISEADYTERAYWDHYRSAYERAIAATTTKKAPWYVVPADHKWFRNLAVSQIVAETLKALHLGYPKAKVDIADVRRRYHAASAAR